MFDWFVDTAMELRGIDVNARKKLKEEKIRLEKENQYIFSKKIKILIIGMGILHLLMTGSVILATKGAGLSSGYILKSIFLCIMDIATILALLIGKKKGEIVAVVLVIIFIATMYISVFLG